MNSIKILSPEDILLIMPDKEENRSYINHEITQMMLKRTSENNLDYFYNDLPYQEISAFVLNVGIEILSKFEDNEQRDLRWEHVGNTSIPGMPGIRQPDACLIYEAWEKASFKVIKVLQESSFSFWRTGSHNNSFLRDLWFIRPITEEGFLKGSFLTVHMVSKGNECQKILVNVRNNCRSKPLDFNKYKEKKFKKGDEITDYLLNKGDSSVLDSYRQVVFC